MPLQSGARLGPYEVYALLGSGGMGEVYKARDLRLGRSVALKVIHSHIAQEPALRERFEREARAVSSLNHPHICTLYDVGQHEGSEFLVMEFVEGETLAERLTRGALPLGLAIQCAIEIAKGLDHAHRHGITHRDLKPANVILSRTGAKLLDFGLAKLRDYGAETTRSLDSSLAKLEKRRQAMTTISEAVTTPSPLTEIGTVLGTFEYMAPEQMEGREADERTDIFAFGAVVYEAITGRRAFEGQSRASLIGAVLMTEPPPMRERQTAVPELLDHVVRRCLSKDPDERWQSVRDLLVALQWVADGVPTLSSGRERTRHGRLIAALGLAAVAIGLLAWNLMAPVDRSEATMTKWEIPAPAGAAFAAELVPSLAVSADGSHLVFRAESGGASRLYLRRPDQFEPRPIEGSEGAHSPFFSPDGQWVGFLAKSRIYRAAVSGGPALPIADAQSLSPGSPGVTWGRDGTIVFAAGASGLMRVSEGGGAPTPLTTPDCSRGEVAHVGPQFLPGGRELLFTIRMADGSWRVAVLSLATGQWGWLPAITGDVAGARYVSTGHLIYAQAGSLTAIPFDLSRREFTGPPRPLSEPVYTRTVADAVVAQFAVSDGGGQLAYVSGRPPEWTLVSERPGDAPRPLGDVPHLYRYPRVSRDGSSVAVSIEEERTDVYLVDATLGRLRRLTDTGSNTQPAWTPDSQRVTFASRRGGSCGWDVYSVRADGSEAPQRLLERDGSQFPTGWLTDGTQLAFYELTNATARDVWVWFAGEKRAQPVAGAASPANERGATFSRDGRLLAYVSNEAGRDDIYVQAYPGPGARVVVSVGGGTEPVWSPTGSELFYRNGDALFAVLIRTEPRIDADRPRALFTGSYVPSPTETGLPNYDVFPDGRTFVMVRSAVTSEMHVRVIQNWFTQLATADQR